MTPYPVGRGLVELEYHSVAEEGRYPEDVSKERNEERQEILLLAQATLRGHVAATDVLLNQLIAVARGWDADNDYWAVYCQEKEDQVHLHFTGSQIVTDNDWNWFVGDSADRKGHRKMVGLVYSTAANRQSAVLNDWIVQAIALVKAAPLNHPVKHSIALATI